MGRWWSHVDIHMKNSIACPKPGEVHNSLFVFLWLIFEGLLFVT